MKGIPELLEFTYSLNGLGSEVLFQALKDPNIEVIGPEVSKLPKMDKVERLHGASYFENSKSLH